MALGLDEVRPQGLKSDFRGPAMQRIVLSTFFALMLGTAPFRAHADATASTASHLDLPISGNPLLHAWTAPFNAPPFEQIDVMHFAPAVEEAIRRQQEDLQRIRSQSAKPSFSNTIEALELAGRDLRRIARRLHEPLQRQFDPGTAKTGGDVAADIDEQSGNAVCRQRAVLARQIPLPATRHPGP
jgi:hypothetical protein